jgi:ceramide glucosyltransferase
MELFFVFAALTIMGLIAYGFQIWSIRSTLKKTYKDTGEGEEHLMLRTPLPAVSILKPLKGIDDNLFDNIESFCIQDYPEYEIIFALQDHNDPAYKVAGKIKEKYPETDISIIVQRCNTGLNPKVNNLIPAYKNAKYGHILISDSNVMVGRTYLKEIVRHIADPREGLVSNLIMGVGGRTVSSAFENLHLNSFIMGSVCFLDKFLRMPCVVGKSMLMRKSDLEAIGGFNAVKDVLAEDYIIGKKMHEYGKKVILSNYMIKNVNEYWGIRKFLNRHTRWGKLRWNIGGIRYLSELFSNAVFMSFLPMMLSGPSTITLSFASAVAFIKATGDYYINRLISRHDSYKRATNSSDYRSGYSLFPIMHSILSPVKDLIIGVVWFVPLFSNTVVWRGNRYVIGKDTLLSECPESGIFSWRYRLLDTIKTRLA